MRGTRSRPAPLGPDYTRLWLASAASNLGDGVFLVGLPLLAATLTRSPGRVAAVVFAGRLPWLLLALVSGALVDRWDRRRVMWVVDALRFGVVALLAVAVAGDVATIPLLMVGAFVLGVGETLFDNAAQSIVATLVRREPERLQRANARQYGTEILTNQFAGPPAGGFLFTVGRAAPFVADALSFAVSSVLIAGVRAGPAASRPATDGRRRLTVEIAAGVRWLWRHRLLRTLGLMVGSMNLAFTAGEAVLVLFAQDILHAGPVGFGLLLLGGAAGGLVGSLVGTRLVRRLGDGPVLVGSAAVIAVAQLAVGLVSEAWAVGALFAVAGFASLTWNVITVSLRQSIVPEQLLGRVNSVYRLLAWGTMPVGAAAGGLLASWLGLRAPFVLGGAALMLVPVLAARVVDSDAVAAARAASGGPAPPVAGATAADPVEGWRRSREETGAVEHRQVEIVFEGEDRVELEGLLLGAGATDVEEVTEASLLPIIGVAIAAVIGLSGLANVVMKLSTLWRCGVVVDARGAVIRTERTCDLPRGTVLVFTADGVQHTLHEPSEVEIADLVRAAA